MQQNVFVIAAMGWQVESTAHLAPQSALCRIPLWKALEADYQLVKNASLSLVDRALKATLSAIVLPLLSYLVICALSPNRAMVAIELSFLLLMTCF